MSLFIPGYPNDAPETWKIELSAVPPLPGFLDRLDPLDRTSDFLAFRFQAFQLIQAVQDGSGSVKDS